MDMCPKEKLIPGGILEPVTGRSFLFFGTSYKTSDFLCRRPFSLLGREKAGSLGCETDSLSLMLITDRNAADAVPNS